MAKKEPQGLVANINEALAQVRTGTVLDKIVRPLFWTLSFIVVFAWLIPAGFGAAAETITTFSDLVVGLFQSVVDLVVGPAEAAVTVPASTEGFTTVPDLVAGGTVAEIQEAVIEAALPNNDGLVDLQDALTK